MTALAGRLNEVSQRLNEKCKLIHTFDLFSVLHTLVRYWFRVGWQHAVTDVLCKIMDVALLSFLPPPFSCVSPALLWSDRPGWVQCQCSGADGLQTRRLLQTTWGKVQGNGKTITDALIYNCVQSYWCNLLLVCVLNLLDILYHCYTIIIIKVKQFLFWKYQILKASKGFVNFAVVTVHCFNHSSSNGVPVMNTANLLMMAKNCPPMAEIKTCIHVHTMS